MPCQTLRLPALAVRSLPSAPMDEERSRVAEILSERMKALNMDWGALADAIDILVPGRFDSTRQMVENWKRRGVPSSQYALVARAVGYTVEQLLGQSSASAGADGWPFTHIPAHRFMRLGPADRLAVESAAMKKIEELEQLEREKNRQSGRTAAEHAYPDVGRKTAT